MAKKSRAPLSQSKAPTVKTPKKGYASASPTVIPTATVSPTSVGGLTAAPILVVLPAGTPSSTSSIGLPGPAGPPGLTGPAGPIGLTG